MQSGVDDRLPETKQRILVFLADIASWPLAYAGKLPFVPVNQYSHFRSKRVLLITPNLA
jgi:hypothetical protein